VWWGGGGGSDFKIARPAAVVLGDLF